MNLGSPTAGADGSVHVDQTYDLNALTGLADGAELSDLLPLDFRSVEIHGLSVASGAGSGTSGEVDGTAGYKATLPVAGADLQAEGASGTVDTSANIPGAYLLGGDGNDRLIGGHGDDVLVGGLRRRRVGRRIGQ
ncbi:MAG: hypothetical protein NVV74_22005 [Magnetospirillum sp.]|nr:hypothetical protein [Magnetospirillum sp.]